MNKCPTCNSEMRPVGAGRCPTCGQDSDAIRSLFAAPQEGGSLNAGPAQHGDPAEAAPQQNCHGSAFGAARSEKQPTEPGKGVVDVMRFTDGSSCVGGVMHPPGYEPPSPDKPDLSAPVDEEFAVQATAELAVEKWHAKRQGGDKNSEPFRVDQSVLGAAGNCQSACLAMLLGLPLHEVPNFLDEPGADKDDEVSFKAQQKWLNDRGWGLVTIQARGPFFKRHFSKGYMLVGGKSPRGLPHAVIYKDGELWHDPHPDRGGVVEIEEVDILYPLTPFAGRSATPRALAALARIRDEDLTAHEQQRIAEEALQEQRNRAEGRTE